MGETPERWKLWLCDSCGDWAENGPGEECEYCDGTIREVEVVRASALEDSAREVERVGEELRAAQRLYDKTVDAVGAHERVGSEVAEELREFAGYWRDLADVGPNATTRNTHRERADWLDALASRLSPGDGQQKDPA